jgi:hypothetical protein
MTKEDKELLLKDLCARLSYGVKVAIEYSKGKYTNIYDLKEIDNDATSELRRQVAVWNYGIYSSVISYPLRDCRPYLRSMSSMTDKEREKYQKFIFPCPDYNGKVTIGVYHRDLYKAQDWLNTHHFDFRGLIPKGLAIEVTKENNPYK